MIKDRNNIWHKTCNSRKCPANPQSAKMYIHKNLNVYSINMIDAYVFLRLCYFSYFQIMVNLPQKPVGYRFIQVLDMIFSWMLIIALELYHQCIYLSVIFWEAFTILEISNLGSW